MATLHLETRLNTSTLPADPTGRVVYLLVEVRPAASGEAVRLPVNLGLVVDVSESMCIPMLNDEQFEALARRGAVREVMADGIGVWQFENVPPGFADNLPRAIRFVKDALRQAVETLGPADTLSVVAFARDAKTVVKRQSGQHKSAALAAIANLERVRLGNETYMAAGLRRGLSEAAGGVGADRVNRLLVLTDGFTLDEAECRAVVAEAVRRGFTVSTLGLGLEFNEELMIELAEASGGNAHLIDGPAAIPTAFAQEMRAFQSVVQRNVELRLRFSEGVELRAAHRVKPTIADLGKVAVVERSCRIGLGDLGQDSPSALLLELQVPPRPAGTYRLAHLALTWESPRPSGQPASVEDDVVVQYAGEARAVGGSDPVVMGLAERVTAYQLQTRAKAEVAAGNTAEATQKLRAAATRLLNLGESDLAAAALAEAQNLEQQGSMSAEGAKRLRYATRRLTQKLEP